jgi:hypothetical protein
MSRKKVQPNNSVFFEGENKYGKNTLRTDNLFVNPRLVNLSQLTGIETDDRVEQVVIVTDPLTQKDKIINAVSNKYGNLPNEKFVHLIEERLDGAGIGFIRQSINRNNEAFAIDYILSDDNMHVNIKGGKDKIKPMMRVLNSYNGSSQTEGHFGFFREVCSNGLHTATDQLNFKIRHRGNMEELVIPKIEDLIAAFMDNEYYSLHQKFEVLAEKHITDVEGFVKYTLGETGLLKYSKSEKNPDDPSIGAQFIIDVINNEAQQLGTKPNLWLGYNAFNEYIHTQNQQVFMLQERTDHKLFDAVMAQAN